MPFSRVPGARRDASVEYISDIGVTPRYCRWPSPSRPPHAGRVGWGRCRGAESDCDDGDIVDGAALERQGDQAIAGLLGRVFARHRKYFLVLHMSGEAVAADHKDVARLQRAAFDLKLRTLAYADGPRYHISTGPHARLFGGELSFGNEFLHLRMIDRYLFDPALADAVDAAVAGPYAGVVAIENKQNRHRRADEHAAFVGEFLETVVGADDVPLAAGQQFGCCGRRRDCVEFFHHNPARDVARFVAAHAVRHSPQAAARRHKVIVLVLPPHLADMRCRAGLNP